MGSRDENDWGNGWEQPEQAFEDAYNKEELRIVMVERRLERLEAALLRIERALAQSQPQPQSCGGAWWGTPRSEIEVRYDRAATSGFIDGALVDLNTEGEGEATSADEEDAHQPERGKK